MRPMPGLKTRPTCVTQMGSGAGFEWVLFDQVRCDEGASDQVLLNDPLEHRRIALAIPRAFGIHHGDGTTLADAKAIHLAAQDAALFREAELSQAALEEFPRCEPTLLLAAFRRRLIAAEKDVPPRHRNADRRGNLALQLG